MQNLLLQPPAFPGYEVSAVYEPAQEVGGDFYQAVQTKGGTLVVVGDVSGKGLKAAMVVSLLVGALRARAGLMPAALLAELNQALAGGMGGGFVTCVAARFAADGSGWIANAGHLMPYCDGRELEVASGLPLGLTAVPQSMAATTRMMGCLKTPTISSNDDSSLPSSLVASPVSKS